MSSIEEIGIGLEDDFATQIKVIGVGGGGGNAVNHMVDGGVKGVEFIIANTDAQALANSKAHRIIQLGSNGQGAGSLPDKGREAAEQAAEDIREAIQGADMLFITAGLGGGTGTGAAPVVARIAKEMGILTVAVVTKPFSFEGSKRMKNADMGLLELEGCVDSLIVVLNEKLNNEIDDDGLQSTAFAMADDVLKNAVGGIAEIISNYGKVNVDFADVKTVMQEQGRAMMGTALASGPNRAREAAEQAVICPLLEGEEIADAKAVLVLITASNASLRLAESRRAMETIQERAAPDANVIFGAAYDDSLGDVLRVTVVATGLAHGRMRRSANIHMVRGTGTDGSHTATPHATAAHGSPMIPTPANMDVPVLNVHPQMNPAVAVPGFANSNFANTGFGSAVERPAVWRQPDRTMSPKASALNKGGIDNSDVPAYLRKQTD